MLDAYIFIDVAVVTTAEVSPMTISEVYVEARRMTSTERIDLDDLHERTGQRQIAGLEQTYPLGSYFCDKCWTAFDAKTKKPRNEPKIPLSISEARTGAVAKKRDGSENESRDRVEPPREA